MYHAMYHAMYQHALTTTATVVHMSLHAHRCAIPTRVCVCSIPAHEGALHLRSLLQNRTFAYVLPQLCTILCSNRRQDARYAFDLTFTPLWVTLTA